ncbi:hypothetical protein AYR62_13405 [Secundilactobacillus paracollinoides]|uniref:HXXEE domain-containing protein n=1 Tax=Secundilactobacillus paracollinoides TaxID=240427 RepID=UPI0006D16B3B|nr:HXXEE domain-containing protein [Secundilactobacillus paracollinoides]ANZ64973.1 hypothetical protein AYR62_13405 [Secundilactobacillus paracollinoides]KRL78863.1 hypothetical protein FC17_GL000880 [Secundilactobacillus paracollinoides DSM 15502 = JCM 11969]
MKIIINNWYRFGAVILIIMAALLAVMRPDLTQIQWLLIANFMALLAHQVEEYQFPGGAPMFINRVVYDERQLTDRYPGNTLSICLVNTSAWVIYVISIVLPHVYWLGLGVMLFSLFQILGHLVEMNIKLKIWYNPGLATTMVLFLPIGWRYIAVIVANDLLSGWGWLFGGLMLIICILVTIVMPVQVLKNKKTPYVISDWQIARFHQIVRFASLTRKGSSK